MFRTHTGEYVTGEALANACAAVAANWRELAQSIRTSDAYATHVSEETKDDALARGLSEADAIEAGEIASVAMWQRVNFQLTGEDVAILP